MPLGNVVIQPAKVVGSHTSNNTISTATSLTAPAGAGSLIIQALTQNVRYTLDGTPPTTTTGFQLKAGDPPRTIPIGAAGQVVKVIEETATAVIQYQWAA